MKSNKKLIREIISDVKHDMSDEEILNMLATAAFPQILKRKNIQSVSVPPTELPNLQAVGPSYFRLRQC